MRTIAIANQKGGCGKTTVTINLAACLAREGRRTLAIDLDPQSHLALGLAVPEEQIEVSVTDLLRTDPQQADLSRFTWQISSNFDLVPSKTDLSQLERETAGDGGREQRLKASLESVREKYDFVILDTPPTIGFLTEAALFAADEVIVPVDTGYFSLHGLSKQMDTLRQVRSEWNKPLTLRIVANHYDVRTKLAREILAELRKRHGDAMFTTFINFNTKLKESASLGQPITEYDPSSSGCRDFVRFAREVIALSQPAVTAPPVAVASSDAGQPTAPPRTEAEQSLMDRADALAADAEKLLATTQTLVGRPQEEVQGAASGNGHAQSAEQRVEQPAPIAERAPDPVRTAEKIERIYGPRAVDDGVVFVIRAEGANRVQIAGDFNDWNPDRTPLANVDHETFQIKVPLMPGRYQYRYVVDGHWRNDPDNHNVEMNPYGELNNVIDVGAEPVAV